MAEESLTRLADRYRRFAADEAQDVSPPLRTPDAEIAESPAILRFLGELPAPRHQPNLLLGAATLIAGQPPDIASLTDMVANRADALRATMLRRTTRNQAEPARCAVLLPLLAALPQPLALIEVGASAGLCLLPGSLRLRLGHVRMRTDQSRRACLPLYRDRSGAVAGRAAAHRLARRSRSQSARRHVRRGHGLAERIDLAGAGRPPRQSPRARLLSRDAIRRVSCGAISCTTSNP